MIDKSDLGKGPVAWISQKGPALQCDPDPGWSGKCDRCLLTLTPTLLTSNNTKLVHWPVMGGLYQT